MFVLSLTSQERSRAIDRQKGSQMRPNLVAALLAAMAPGMAAATEGGGSYQTLGLNTIMPGFMAPPGLYGNVFIQHYDANRTVDRSGTVYAVAPSHRVSGWYRW